MSATATRQNPAPAELPQESAGRFGSAPPMTVFEQVDALIEAGAYQRDPKYKYFAFHHPNPQSVEAAEKYRTLREAGYEKNPNDPENTEFCTIMRMPMDAYLARQRSGSKLRTEALGEVETPGGVESTVQLGEPIKVGLASAAPEFSPDQEAA